MIYRSPSTKIITDVVTFANARIWEPQIILEDKPPIYTASVIIPKSMVKTNEGLNTAIETAIRMGVSLHRGKFGKSAKNNLPIFDGDSEELDEIFSGSWVVNAATLTAPIVYDNVVTPITDCSLLQPGCKVRVVLNFFSYTKRPGHGTGVGCMLGNIQKAFTRNDYQVLTDKNFDLFTENFTRIFLKEDSEQPFLW